MNAYKVFVASVVFFALFTGATNFQQSFYEGQNVQSNSTTELDQEYNQLQGNIDDIRENVRQVQSPDTGLLDSAVAGLYLVPNFLTLILSPITILGSTIDSIAVSHVFIPQFAATALKYLVYIGVSWSAFRLLIGLRG